MHKIVRVSMPILMLFMATGGNLSAQGESENTAAANGLNGKEFSAITRVRVEGAFCAVSAEGSSSAKVKVALRIDDKATQVLYEEKNQELHIWVKRDYSLFNGGVRGENRISLELPRGTDCSISNSSGSVKVSQHTAAHIDVSASSGNVSVTDCSGVNALTTSSGNLELKNARGDIQGSSSSGNQLYENITGSIHSQASSGELQFSKIDGDLLLAESSSGSIQIKGFQGKEVTLTSSSGNQRLENVRATLRLRATSGELTGQAITLAGDSSFATSSGNIVMQLTNEKDCSFELTSSSGSLSARGTKGQRQLSVPGGPLKVKAGSSSGIIRF